MLNPETGQTWTWAEHANEAERLITEANHVGHSDSLQGLGILQAAQVHATLAIARKDNYLR